MNNTIQYKDYVGSIEFSEEDKIFYGKVLGIRSLISYEGENATELIDDFHQAVDDYLHEKHGGYSRHDTAAATAIAPSHSVRK